LEAPTQNRQKTKTLSSIDTKLETKFRNGSTMTFFHIISHSPIRKGLMPEYWRGLNESSTARSLAAARMPANFGADEPPCERTLVEYFTTAETLKETFDVINAHDTESKSPERPHEDVDSPTVFSNIIIAASYDSLTVSGLKTICKEKGITIPSEIKTKSKIIELLSEIFPDATDILGSVPLVLFTTEALQSKCKTLGLPTYCIKCKLIEQLESHN
jgi:hypothetical protein